MKTLSNYIKENQLVANIVRSELNRGREVYLVLNKRTGNTVVTSQPLLWDGKLVKEAIGFIAGNEGGLGGDEYSTPIDTISNIEQIEVPFAKIDEDEVELVIITTDENRAQLIQIAFEERNKTEWNGDFKQYSLKAGNIEEVKTYIQFDIMFDYNISWSDFKIIIK